MNTVTISKTEYAELLRDKARLDWVENDLNALVEHENKTQSTEWLIEAPAPWRSTVREAIDRMEEQAISAGKCEGCGEPSTTVDDDGISLCAKCADAGDNEAPPNNKLSHDGR